MFLMRCNNCADYSNNDDNNYDIGTGSDNYRRTTTHYNHRYATIALI